MIDISVNKFYTMKVGIIGLGFVGSAIKASFELKNIDVFGYDKFKDGGIGSLSDMFQKNILFLCLPTPFDEKEMCYDITSIQETCKILSENAFSGLLVIKSTIEPTTTDNLSKEFNLKIIHNPEFLTEATAYEDFHNQKHIVLGKGVNVLDEELNRLYNLYNEYYPDAAISLVSSEESECMKLFVNSFYATKIQFFNELYLLCKNIDCNYDSIKELMLKNNWIHPMHTKVPGRNNELSYGGNCFPKDTNALLQYMKRNNSKHEVLEAVINERNSMRK